MKGNQIAIIMYVAARDNRFVCEVGANLVFRNFTSALRNYN